MMKSVAGFADDIDDGIVDDFDIKTMANLIDRLKVQVLSEKQLSQPEDNKFNKCFNKCGHQGSDLYQWSRWKLELYKVILMRRHIAIRNAAHLPTTLNGSVFHVTCHFPNRSLAQKVMDVLLCCRTQHDSQSNSWVWACCLHCSHNARSVEEIQINL